MKPDFLKVWNNIPSTTQQTHVFQQRPRTPRVEPARYTIYHSEGERAPCGGTMNPPQLEDIKTYTLGVGFWSREFGEEGFALD